MLDNLTLDQIRVFVTIAETGSFRAAAAKLARVQSAVSHAIANLEAELGIIAALVKGDQAGAVTSARDSGLITTAKDGSDRIGREALELEPKLARLGLPIPW